MADMNNQTLPIPNPQDWMTVGAAAFLLGVSRPTVYRLIDTGALTAYYPQVGYKNGRPESANLILWARQVNDVLDARLTLTGGNAHARRIAEGSAR